MSQRYRFDERGAWLHAMNRGVARRTIFESRADMRFFLACLAKAVRAGWFEVHAYALLATHFHLLLRSLVGESWRGLRLVQNAYARRFNTQRRRDGPLFRGRFCSKRIRSDRYWMTVVRYIDQNAPSAGLVGCPELWPFGSAADYLGRSRGPPWLERSVIESVAAGGSGEGVDPETYRSLFSSPLSDLQRSAVERRLQSSADVDDAFDDLVGAAPPRVAAWMRRKALLADGTSPGVPVVQAASLEAALAERCPIPRGTSEPSDGALSREWTAVRAGFLRHCAGATYREIALRLGCSEAAAHGRVRAFSGVVERARPCAQMAVDGLVATLAADWSGLHVESVPMIDPSMQTPKAIEVDDTV